MKIEKRINTMLAVSLVIVTAFGASMLYSFREERRVVGEHDTAEETYQKAFKLNALTYDYLMYPTERALEQWRQLSDELGSLSSNAIYAVEEQKAILQKINNKHHVIVKVFDSLVQIHSEHSSMDAKEHEAHQELEVRLSSHLLREMQTVIDLNILIGRLSDERLRRVQHIALLTQVSFFLVLFMILVVNFLWQRKGIVLPVIRLQKGAEIIGTGNLDYRVGTDAQDEIGQLSRAFDRMVENVKAITVSRDVLTSEINYSQAVIDSLPGLFYLFDDQGRFLRWNKSFEKVSGYSSEEIARISPLDLFDEADKHLIAERIKQVFLTGESVVEADFVSKNQSRTPCLFSGKLFHIEGKPCLIGMGIDITKRKQMEEKLKQYTDELKRSNEDLEQFAYVASHDLQEPLRMVSSYTELLARHYEGRLDAKAKKFMDYAVDGATRMQRLINDLLAYSRVGTRGKPLEATDTHALLGEAIKNLAAMIEENRAVITNDDLPTVRADASQLVQVFQNLLSNAAKFQGGNVPRIHVSAQDKGREWVFSVRDNGIGIERQYADRIFIIFQRLHTRQEYPGTGIGLALCKRIVERHGGRIWFESESGKGTTFFFTIPK